MVKINIIRVIGILVLAMALVAVFATVHVHATDEDVEDDTTFVTESDGEAFDEALAELTESLDATTSELFEELIDITTPIEDPVELTFRCPGRVTVWAKDGSYSYCTPGNTTKMEFTKGDDVEGYLSAEEGFTPYVKISQNNRLEELELQRVEGTDQWRFKIEDVNHPSTITFTQVVDQSAIATDEDVAEVTIETIETIEENEGKISDEENSSTELPGRHQ